MSRKQQRSGFQRKGMSLGLDMQMQSNECKKDKRMDGIPVPEAESQVERRYEGVGGAEPGIYGNAPVRRIACSLGLDEAASQARHCEMRLAVGFKVP